MAKPAPGATLDTGHALAQSQQKVLESVSAEHDFDFKLNDAGDIVGGTKRVRRPTMQ